MRAFAIYFVFLCKCLILSSAFTSNVCRTKCNPTEYEFTPCNEILETQCKDTVTLPGPSLSRNLIYENRHDVKQITSAMIRQDVRSEFTRSLLTFKRGSGFSIQVSIQELNLAPLYATVDHSASNDNEGVSTEANLLKQHCPYPLPDKYHLSVILHRDVTTRARYFICNGSQSAKTGKRCSEESGYFLNPTESCRTYSVFGRLPALDPKSSHVLCTRPGKLSDTFGVSRDISDVTSMFADPSVKCAEQRTRCDACTVMCARRMQSYTGSHRCNVTSDDADNGQSPRLAYCFSCCNVEECSQVCDVYRNPDCKQTRCVTGNVAEFVLTPVFPSSDASTFVCHVEPARRYRVYDVEYSVLYRGEVVNERRLTARRTVESAHPRAAADTHDFLMIHFDSRVNATFDLVSGNAVTGTFTPGEYTTTGEVFTAQTLNTKSLYIRPRGPFSISSKTWRRETCDTDVMSEFYILPESSQTGSSNYNFRNTDLNIEYLSNGTYRVTNNSQNHFPFIYFEIAQNASILRPLYPRTTVVDDASLKAELVRRDREWILHLQGRIKACPGSFEVIVRDPNYPAHAVYHCDFGAVCPNDFSIDFMIPTEGPDFYDKTLVAEIVDYYRTIKLTIFRPFRNLTTSIFEVHAPMHVDVNRAETPLAVISPFVTFLCVVIIILGLLLAVGFVSKQDAERHRFDSALHSRRLLFVIVYVTFRATYSLAVTFTVLFLIIRHVNRASLSTLGEFSSFIKSASDNQTLELDKIQSVVFHEVERQNLIANETRVVCEHKLTKLQSTLEQMTQEMRVRNEDQRLVSQVALEYTKIMVANLTQNIERFKRDFAAYATQSLKRLSRSMAQTPKSLQTNKWLAGARVLYDAVRSKRSAQGHDTRAFMDWVGIRQQQMDAILTDTLMKNFPQPNFTDLLSIDLPQAFNERQVPIQRPSETVLPRNQWYFQYEKKPPSNGRPSGATSTSSKELKTGLDDVISVASLLTALFVIDAVWFVHRMAKTYSTAQALLYGRSQYQECRTQSIDEAPSPRIVAQRPSQPIRCLQFLKELNLRVMKTEFVPKVIASVSSLCALYVLLSISDRLLSTRTLVALGYFDALVAPVETSYKLGVARIEGNAQRIARFEFPLFEQLVNVRSKRYQLVLDMHAELQRGSGALRAAELCAWKRLLVPADPCDCVGGEGGDSFPQGRGPPPQGGGGASPEGRGGAPGPRLKFEGCDLPPVTPLVYHRHDFSQYQDQLVRSMAPYITAARHVIAESCYLVVLFIAVIVLVDVMWAVLWIYLQRFQILTIKPTAQLDQDTDAVQ